MKVKTTIKFRDLKAGTIRKVGEEFECSEDRFKEILKKGPFVEEVKEEPAEEAEAEAVEETEAEPEEEPAPKKTTRKTTSKAAKAE